MSAITPVDEEPAEYGSYRPGCLLIDHNDTVVMTLPIGVWPQLRAWHRNLDSRPLLFRDNAGQVISVDRGYIARIDRRDVCAVVTLEAYQRDTHDPDDA